ncbi:hypothetical protein N431DRAFT_552360 [Stipitochalara longipes BDJ]|nr:hypothetical protein N431DRAFT_552360 [Stipitochalara longipes BDJ]
MSQPQSKIEPLFASSPASQTGPLWGLPPEIREVIYDHLLPAPDTLHPAVDNIFIAVTSNKHGRSRFRTHETVLALARTCQVFYTELIPFYYRTKAFSFDNAYDLYRYLNMIGSYRRQQIQRIDFWLRPGISRFWTTSNQQVYEWTCEMLIGCRSLRKFGVGVSEHTKDHRMGDGPIKGLEALTGLGFRDLEVRVREVSLWGSKWRSVWDMQLDDRPESFNFFDPSVVKALEEKLCRNMKSEKSDVSKEERTRKVKGASGANDEVHRLRSSPKKTEGKREPPTGPSDWRWKQAKIGNRKRK